MNIYIYVILLQDTKKVNLFLGQGIRPAGQVVAVLRVWWSGFPSFFFDFGLGV